MIRRVHHNHHPEDSYSSENSSDLFSPIRARRFSLHQNTPDTPANNEIADNPDNDDGDDDENKTLPRLHNTSWIGARVSPIPSIDEDEENDLLVTAPYRKAMQQQQTGYSSIAANTNTTERAFLMPGSDLGSDVNTATANGHHHHHPMISTRIHPLWNQGTPPLQQRDRKRRRQQQLYEQQQKQTSRFAYIVIVVTGIHLSCIGIHDFYLWYLSYRKDIEPKYSLAWNLPFLTPSSPRTLSRFGVFIPLSIIQLDDYWRSLSSLSTTTSVVEWAILAWIWGRELKTADGAVWPIIFVLSCLTGQLWMVAFHRDGISGCASWGTGGCACALGVKRPNSRFELFLFSIALLLVNLFQPYSSVYGAIGGIFFGWCCHGIGLAVPPPRVPEYEENLNTPYKKQNNNNGCIDWVATLGVIKLWTIPIAYMIWKTFFSSSMDETP